MKITDLPAAEEILVGDVNVPPLSQLSQEALQAVAYQARTGGLKQLPSAEELLAEDADVPPLSQLSQESLQAVAHRVRESEN